MLELVESNMEKMRVRVVFKGVCLIFLEIFGIKVGSLFS